MNYHVATQVTTLFCYTYTLLQQAEDLAQQSCTEDTTALRRTKPWLPDTTI